MKKTILFAILSLLITVTFGIGQTESKNFVAVLELDQAGITTEESRILTDRLRYELIRTNHFTVLERSKMEEILKEQTFQLSGCTSDECLVEVGRLVGVQFMVGGSVGKIGNLYTVNVRLIDVETATVTRNAVVDYRGTIDGLLTEGLKKAARRLAGLERGDEEMVQQKNRSSLRQPVNRKKVTTLETKGVAEKVEKKASGSYKWDVDFAAGRSTITLTNDKFSILDNSKSFTGSLVYFSVKYNVSRRMGLFMGIGAGNYDKSNDVDQIGIEKISYSQFLAGFEYRLGRLFSIGTGFVSSAASVKLFNQTDEVSLSSKGAFLRGGIHIPIGNILQLDGYMHGASGTNPQISFYSVGINIRL
ncbi:MAG: hypothetical protein Kow00108_18020 [Calditrichia bacterium]